MTSTAKRIGFWVVSALMVFVVAYCALAIVQAGSIYTGERALFNLRFWGAIMGASLIVAVLFGILAARVGKSRPQQ